MKKIHHIILLIVGALAIIWLFFFSRLVDTQEGGLLINLILINILIYITRSFLLQLSPSLFKNVLVRYVFNLVVNIIWLVFVFWLIYVFESLLFIAIVSFLIVAISLTFQNIINNIASGIMLISGEGFEAGDLIETNGVQGIINELTLNYVKLKQFDGIKFYIPNKNVFNASVTRFTHKKTELTKLSDEEGKEKLKAIAKRFTRTIVGKEKMTRFIKVLEILGSIEYPSLKEKVSTVFDKYEPIFGIRPYYYANTTVVDRLSITIQVLTNDPNNIMKYMNPFLKDLFYAIYEKEIYMDYEASPLENSNNAINKEAQ